MGVLLSTEASQLASGNETTILAFPKIGIAAPVAVCNRNESGAWRRYTDGTVDLGMGRSDTAAPVSRRQSLVDRPSRLSSF